MALSLRSLFPAGVSVAALALTTVIVPAASATPASQSGTLDAVSCASPVSCLAVGGITPMSSTGLAYAQAWDGHRWHVLPAPPAPGSSAGLDAVDCASPAHCMVLGGSSVHGGFRAFALAWDGGHWRYLPVPGPGNDGLEGISCPRPDRCIAVGEAFGGGFNGALAEQWNGTRWRTLRAVDARAGNSVLHSVSCAGPDWCMAVGGVTETWDGTRWRLRPGPGGISQFLSGVSCTSPVNCIAVGYSFRSGQPVNPPVAERWDGRQWRVLRLPFASRFGATLMSVSCPSPARCMAVGALSHFGPPAGPLADLWNGSTWHALGTASTPGVADPMSVSCPLVSRCVAVGHYLVGGGSHLLAEEWTGTSWTAI